METGGRETGSVVDGRRPLDCCRNNTADFRISLAALRRRRFPLFTRLRGSRACPGDTPFRIPQDCGQKFEPHTADGGKAVPVFLHDVEKLRNRGGHDRVGSIAAAFLDT